MRKLFLLAMVIGTSVAYSQYEHLCGFDALHNHALETDQEYARVFAQSKIDWEQYLNNSGISAHRNTQDGVYEIPVVVHIIHTGQNLGHKYNPTDATVQSYINQLNGAYAGTSTKWNTSVNTHIRFKLAQRDDNCEPTNGITRTDGRSFANYSTQGMTTSGGGANETAIKTEIGWSRANYLNIWIVTKIDNQDCFTQMCTAGFSRLPTQTTSLLDGFVIAAGIWNLTTTAEHEIGHYLGLLHTFGNTTNGSCPPNTNCATQNDMVCDTDPHQYGFDCPSGNNPCTGTSYANIVTNTMSYYACSKAVFTEGQKERMLFYLENYRAGLFGSSLGAVALGDEGTPFPSPIAASCSPASASNPGLNFGPRTIELANLYFGSAGNYGTEDHYVDYTVTSCTRKQAPPANLEVDLEYTLSVLTAAQAAQNAKVWIDWNNNGTFETGEVVLASTGSGTLQTHTTSFTVPSTAVKDTPLRMRVYADYSQGQVNNVTPCQNLTAGQIEDYMVVVSESLSTPVAAGTEVLRLYPNPVGDELHFSQKLAKALVYSADGKLVAEAQNEEKLNVNNLAQGIYILKGENEKGEHYISKFVKK